MFDHAANMVARFVEAADNLVNLLATKEPESKVARELLETKRTYAYSAYDEARRALVGDPAASDD